MGSQPFLHTVKIVAAASWAIYHLLDFIASILLLPLFPMEFSICSASSNSFFFFVLAKQIDITYYAWGDWLICHDGEEWSDGSTEYMLLPAKTSLSFPKLYYYRIFDLKRRERKENWVIFPEETSSDWLDLPPQQKKVRGWGKIARWSITWNYVQISKFSRWQKE